MTENDIYDNQRRYERIKEQLELLALKPEERDHLYRNAKYYCKNKKNLEKSTLPLQKVINMFLFSNIPHK